MTISSLDEMIAALPGQKFRFIKAQSATLQAAGQHYSPWLLAGMPGAGAAPSSGVAGDVPTDATLGSVPFVNPPAGQGKLTYLQQLAASPSAAGMLLLYDRLWQNSGLSPTTLTAQTVASVALPARTPDPADQSGETFNTNGHGVEAWLDVYAVMGAGSTAPTISYTNSDGVAGRTGTLQGFVTTAAVGRVFNFSLQAGDKGIQSIQSYTNGATMTSGTFGLVLRRLLASVAIPQAITGQALDWSALGLPVIPDDTCLELLWIPNGTSAVVLQGNGVLAQG